VSTALQSIEAVEVFFSYAREDEDLRDELEKHLAILKRQGVITSWHDRKIGVGKEWECEIDKHLNTARVILLLISPDFMASDYCWSVEVERAMERHKAGEACVIPIILRPVYWEDTPFDKLQALPKGAKPVTSWSNRDEAFLDVADGIKVAVEQLIVPKMEDDSVSDLAKLSSRTRSVLVSLQRGDDTILHLADQFPGIRVDRDSVRHELIRVSISALVRIRVYSKHLLVRGLRIDQYQPVGGVLKRLPSSLSLLAELGVCDDEKIPIDADSENDLRVMVPRSALIPFLEWYDTGKGREISPWREFYDELIAPGILPADRFPYIYYDYVKRNVTGIQYSEYFQCDELLIAEIYELIPTRDQLEALKALQSKSDEKYIWTTESLIRSRGVDPPKNFTAYISNHAVWIL
jgi:hypothetical protein